MPDKRRVYCQDCGGHRDAVGGISWTGLCVECGVRRAEDNNYGISGKRGEPWLRWRRQMILCAGGVLPDKLQARS